MIRNQIISQKMGPLVRFLTLMTFMGVLSVVALNKEANSIQEKHKIDRAFMNVVNGFSVGLLALIFICCALAVYNNANKTASYIARKYINKHPDFKQFDSVLNNPASMRRIATQISNELHKSEQQQVLNLIKQIELTSTNEQIEEIYNKIVAIIEEHAKIHSEFMPNLYSVVMNESYALYVKQIQRQNSKTK